MGTPEGHQKKTFLFFKYVEVNIFLNPVSIIHNGIYPTKFANSTQKHKKVIETPNQPIEIKTISNKRIFSTSKVKRRQKFGWGLPHGVCRLNPKS
jgi:hypothetical protein